MPRTDQTGTGRTDQTGIEHADLLERMNRLLTAAAPQTEDPQTEAPQAEDPQTENPQAENPQTGGLAAPMPALNAAPRTLAQVYGPGEGKTGGRLLMQLGAEAEARGDTALATLCAALEGALHDGTLDLAPPPAPAPRLVRYVYPVI